LRAQVEAQWISVAKRAEESSESDVVGRVSRVLEENSGYWQEVEGLLQMSKEAFAGLHVEWDQLEEVCSGLCVSLKDRLKYRQKVISLRESNKTIQNRIKAEEQRIEALQQIQSLAKKLETETAGSARIASEIGSAFESLCDKQKRSEQSAKNLYDKSNDQRTKLRQQLSLTKESFNENSESDGNQSVADELVRVHVETLRVEQEAFVLERELQRIRKIAKRKAALMSASSAEDMRDQYLRDLRKRRNCSVKTNLEKDTLLPRCGHAFSRAAVDEMKNRKCPICGERFSPDEPRPIFF